MILELPSPGRPPDTQKRPHPFPPHEYDPNTNNIANIAYNHRGDSNEVDYSYDDLDRLALAEYSIDDSNEAFTMDDLGNRNSVTLRDDSSVSYTVDANTNRYTQIGGSTPGYDVAGNLIEDYNSYEYEYDYENRITKITKDETNIAEFAYDALGRRIKKVDSVAGTTNIYYYNDKWQVLLECDGTGTQQRWFAYGNYIDETLMMGTNTSVLSLKLYVHDHLFSPVALIQRYHVEVKERYEYDAYGNCTILSPTYDIRDTSDYDNPYLYTGRTLDILDNGDLKIQDSRHRYYDTYTGRFFTPDPMGYEDSLNLYEYAIGNPLMYTDTWGFSACCGENVTTMGLIQELPIPIFPPIRLPRIRIPLPRIGNPLCSRYSCWIIERAIGMITRGHVDEMFRNYAGLSSWREPVELSSSDMKEVYKNYKLKKKIIDPLVEECKANKEGWWDRDHGKTEIDYFSIGFGGGIYPFDGSWGAALGNCRFYTSTSCKCGRLAWTIKVKEPYDFEPLWKEGKKHLPRNILVSNVHFWESCCGWTPFTVTGEIFGLGPPPCTGLVSAATEAR